MENLSPELNPNPENKRTWEDDKADIIRLTPKERTFIDVIPPKEVVADVEKVREYKEEMGIEEELGISDSRIQEYITLKEIGVMDWFGEKERAGELFTENKKGEGYTIKRFLTSEFDDFMNHIDGVCVVKNDATGSIPTPFALDMTFRTDLDQKMSWRHHDKDVNLPGFTSAKYFKGMPQKYGKPTIKKGRVPIMPRFVIGYSEEISNEIAEIRRLKNPWDRPRREELSTKAKWCVLKELKAQSEQMLAYLEANGYDDARGTLMGKAYSEVRDLDKYFAGSIEVASKKDQNHPDWEAYADSDPVVQAILSRTETMFG